MLVETLEAMGQARGRVDGRLRDLALFKLAIGSKRRGCDVVALRVEERCSARLRQRSDNGPNRKRPDAFAGRLQVIVDRFSSDLLDDACDCGSKLTSD